MRLLHATEDRFESFFDAQIPPYAILSHRWEAQEVSYQELLKVIKPPFVYVHLGITTESLDQPRFAKIEACRAKARQQQLEWVWIDTCCVNKESSAELSESINSMYQWSAAASVCFVYLSDIRVHMLFPYDMGCQAVQLFMHSEWFTRGWTLQELLAPKQVLFYECDWVYFGDRADLSIPITAFTRINREYIVGRKSVHAASVAERMSWASRRSTSRREDIAYCLLGIFDVNRPLLYGEGDKAFMRLQLEIIKESYDESIFAWRRSKERSLLAWEMQQAQADIIFDSTPTWFAPSDHQDTLKAVVNFFGENEAASATLKAKIKGQGRVVVYRLLEPFALHSGLLAQEPADFADSGRIRSHSSAGRFTRQLPYSMTNQGLQFHVQGYPSVLNDRATVGTLFDLALNCYEEDLTSPIVIRLRKDFSGHKGQIWRRLESRSFQGLYKHISMPGDDRVSTPLYIPQDGL